MQQERRPVTILFADVRGFTALSERLDPEVVTDAMNLCFTRLAQEIDRFGGRVDDIRGDEMMALFGAPTAHEDDAVRAVRAALAMQKAMREMAPQLEETLGEQLAFRIGLNTGTVIAGHVGPDGRQQYTVMGDAVNVASRLEGAAPPGSVLVGGATYQQASWAFRWGPRQLLEVKGREEAVLAYEVLEEIPGAIRPRGLEALPTPFVGRRQELETLRRMWELSRSGHAQLVSIVGEAGVGKTRLVSQFELSLFADPARPRVLRGAASAIGNQVYGPFIQILQGLVGGARGATEEGSTGADLVEEESVAPAEDLLAALAQVSEEEEIAPPDKEQLFQRLARLLAAHCDQRPMILILEDLQWTDAATLELLSYLVRRLERIPILLLALYRPWDGQPILRRQARHTVLHLEPLGEAESHELAAAVLGSPGIPASLRDLVLARAEGNPFYLEEVVRSLVEQGALVNDNGRWVCTQAVEEIRIPDSVQGVILARIDQLQEQERRLIQEAAVIGRIFSTRVLAEVTEIEERIQGYLDRLEDADLTRLWQELRREQFHAFKHDLTRDVAYQTLLLRRRAELHRRVAEATERLHRGRLDAVAETLAYHYEQAGDKEKAARYYLLASEKADRVFAERDAQRYRRIAGQLLGLTSVWALYTGENRLRPGVRGLAVAVQSGLAVVIMMPIMAFLMAQDPPPSQVTLGLPLEIMSLNPSALVLAVAVGFITLLITMLGLTHLVAPALLHARPSIRRQLSHVGLAWLASLGAVAMALAVLSIGLRFDILNRTLSYFTGAVALQLLRGRLPLILTIALATFLLSLAWYGWMRLEAGRWRARLLGRAENGGTTSSDEGGLVSIGESVLLLVASAAFLSFIVLMLYLLQVLPGTEEQPGVDRKLSIPLLLIFGGIGLGGLVVRLRLARRDPGLWSGVSTLGIEVPLAAALLFGSLLAFTMRQEVVSIAAEPFAPGDLGGLNRTVALFPNLAVPKFLRSERLWLQGKVDAALADLDGAIEDDPNFAPPYLARSRLRVTRGDFEPALSDANTLIDLKPDHPGGYALRALARYQLGDLEGALEDYQKAIEPLPESTQAWDAFYVRCVALAAGSLVPGLPNRNVEAIGACTRSLELNDKHVPTYDDLGQLYIRERRYADALATYDALVRLAPENPVALSNRGGTYLVLGRYPEAVADLDMAVRILSTPEHLESHDYSKNARIVYGQRARVRLFLDQPDLALDDATQAIQIDPENVNAYLDRAYVATYAGDYDQVIEDANHAMSLGGEQATLLNLRGYALALQGDDLEAALADLNRSIQLDPLSPYAYDSRSYAYWASGEYDLALQDANRALALLPPAGQDSPAEDQANLAEFLYHRALAYEALGQRQEAVRDLERAQSLASAPVIARGIQEALERLTGGAESQ